MGGEMANVKNSDLKVPPLKIVLSSANSGGSDRSSSTSPSSESESLDSNLTIISDNQHDRSSTSKSDHKEESVQSKQERASRQSSKGSASDRNSSNNATPGGKRSFENNGSMEDKVNGGDSVAGRELTSSSTQRITRSSQRAAQQNKSENLGETTCDETIAPDAQDKTIESARKVKRRKGEQPQETEQDSNQQVPPPPPVMPEICPADYELPLQNSFELYRDIRKRPYKKLLKLTNIQPKMPHGFKDYLLNSGPYSLDGDRVGVGVKGGPSVNCKEEPSAKTNRLPNRVPPKLKYTSNQHKLPACLSQQLRYDYKTPNLLEAPKNLKCGSPLYELFQDQERSRLKMRLQHLKERERSILASEQEILRAYSKAATVDLKQDLNLSACTYLYLQERYHYLDEKNDSIDCVNPKDLISNQISPEEDQASKSEPVVDIPLNEKSAFLDNLQEIDEKWAEIKRDMLIRHQNEADSLFAVQSLDWEWKAKEIGACDVRVALKIEPELVPRVEVSALDY